MAIPRQYVVTDYAANAGDYNPSVSCETWPWWQPYAPSRDNPYSQGDDPSYQWSDMSKMNIMSGITFQRSELKIADISDGTSYSGPKKLDHDFESKPW